VLFRLIVLFTVVPIVELALLLKIGAATEWWVPLLLVVLTGLVGAALARHQGRAVLRDIRRELEAGRLPADGLLNGLFVLLGGALLITPGVLTDATGLCCLLPPTRAVLRRWVRCWFSRQIRAGRFVVTVAPPPRDDDWLPG